LSVGNWLLYDLAQRSSEPRLFVVAFLAAVRERALEVDLEQIAEWSARQSTTELNRLLSIPEDAAGSSAGWATTPDQGLEARWSGGALTAAMAAAQLAGLDEDAKARVATMLGELAMAFHIWEDLQSIPQDVMDGRRTVAVELAMSAAGQEATAVLDPYLVLGAMVTTDAVAVIDQAARSRLATARDLAEHLSLPSLVAFTDAAQAAREDLGSSQRGRETLRHRVQPTLVDARRMAESFLLADLTFRESWESHREGMLGADLVASRFPAALILEILCRHGHELARVVDEFIEHGEANGFRYYDHPNADPDSDTVGAVLRLLPFSSAPSRRSVALTHILDCVDRLAVESGQMPVWLTACAEANPERPSTLPLGERCGTVVAHLLLGLMSLGEEAAERAATAQHATRALFDRIVDVGLGANVNYPPRYALLSYLRLLDASGVEHPARDSLHAELERRSALPAASAQDAALALLGTRAARRPDLVDERWIDTILDAQRFDGSWGGEPFAVAPNRGRRATSYSSTTLTTALCYDALALGG
jgi:hypothetical protein